MSHSLEIFFGAWADGDADAIARAVTGDVHYYDPRTPEPLIGVAAVADYVAMYSQYAPGAIAEVVNLSDAGSYARATVAFKMADGNVQHGQYFVDLSDDGRASRLVGFVGLGEPL